MWIKQALILLFITPSFPVHIYIYLWIEEPILARMTWLVALDADQVRGLEFASLNICVSLCLDLES